MMMKIKSWNELLFPNILK